MLTGVEVTGVVLAVLPLVISALEHYSDGAKPLRDFFRYKIVIRQLIIDLGTQQLLLRNTCEKLLDGVVESQITLAGLLDTPGGPGWNDNELAAKLKKRLAGAYNIYMESVKDMESTLNLLKDKIGLDEKGKPRWIDAKTHKKEWKRFMLCLSKKEHESAIARLDWSNRNLKTLTLDSLDLETSRIDRRSKKNPYNRIRDHAKSLHHVLKLGWSCTCQFAHLANLHLELRQLEVTPRFKVSFPATHSSSPLWKETSIHPLEPEDVLESPLSSERIDQQSHNGLAQAKIEPRKSLQNREGNTRSIVKADSRIVLGAPSNSAIRGQETYGFENTTTTAKKVVWGSHKPLSLPKQQVEASKFQRQSDNLESTKIASLCFTLQQERHDSVGLGCLYDEQRKHEVFIVSQPSIKPLGETVSLHEILSYESKDLSLGPPASHIAQASGRKIPCLTKKNRLQLAVTLASTALQLQTTPWLDQTWNRRDILFHDGLIESPHVSKTFSKEQVEPNTSIRSVNPWTPIRNTSIFGLGVLLLELSFGKPLESFKKDDDPAPFTEIAIARRLVDELTEEESSGYADAARACIYCDFGSKVRTSSLDNEVFRQAVYDDVVRPLEEEWSHWTRTTT